MKTFSTIRLDNKSVVYIVRLNEYHSFKIEHVFNGISDTFMGVSFEAFSGSFKALLRDRPDFFNVFEETEPRKSLIQLGFQELPPTELEKLMHNAAKSEHAAELTKEDVWGLFDSESGELVSKGMIVARGVPSIDRFFTQEMKDLITAKTYPSYCPVWEEELPYKSVTVICSASQIDQVKAQLIYVQGGGSISKMKMLDNNQVALRSDYMCW